MLIFDYIFKSFIYYKRQHIAVLIGTIISTAVLTGALIVGDSVKYSLGQIAESRLGSVQYVLQTNNRFIRAKLANEIAEKLNVKSSPILLLEGISSNPETELRINKTQVVGIDSGFWLISNKQMPELKNDEAIISSNTAERLNLKVNDDIVLRVEMLSVIPLNSPFKTEDVPFISFRLKIKAIADNNTLGRFSLKNNQVAPFNVFISREYLGAQMDIRGLANVILFTGGNESTINTGLFNNTIADVWQFKDAGIEVTKLDNTGNYEITSDRVFLDKQISTSILKNIHSAKTILTYLVNSLRLKGKSTPYSFVTAVSENYLGKMLKGEDIIINEWLSGDLNAEVGDTLTLVYFVIDSLRNLKEDSSRFIVKEIIPTRNSLINRSFMPKFPGFTNAVSCTQWNTSIPINLSKIRNKDEKYWNEYRGTPKAVISIAAGQKIWYNDFGNYTSIRFNSAVFKSNSNSGSPDQEILKMLDPNDLNLSVVDVKTGSILAAKNGVDFGELFLSLSFFVILAGVILTGMLYVLSLESRKSEIGLLTSIGYTKQQIIKLRVYESAIIVLIGSILGVFTGILYNYGLLAAINSVWFDIVRAPMMGVDIKPMTLLAGLMSGFVISLTSILIASCLNLRKSSIGLINNHFPLFELKNSKKKGLRCILIFIGFISSFGLLLYSILTSAGDNAGLFLISGGVFMSACFLLTGKIIGRRHNNDKVVSNLSMLAYRNASKNQKRSLTIVILLSLGVFVVIITGANRKTSLGTENENVSGTGGYSFWIETSMPVPYNLNTFEGKEKSGLAQDSVLNNVEFVQLLSHNGDDASCLNLNHVSGPGIIGVNPYVFNKRNSFSFATMSGGINKINPWLSLNKSYADNVIPAYTDQTVITWGLLKKIGDTLTYLNEKGKKLYIILAGGLNASVFQGNILISDKFFKENFPSEGGSKLMLVDAPENKQKAVSELLNRSFWDYGIEITATNERLFRFNSVTNTYLSIFMILGGLGLIISTIGIGIILHRNMIDRKQEIAIISSLGFSKHKIFKLIFFENLFLVITGISIGLVSSILGILPSFISRSFHIPDFYFVIILVILIFANSLFWIYLPIIKVLKENIISSLRIE